jgi:hypothetical protein
MPKVFIGSSTESLEYAEAIQENLDFIAEPMLWTQTFELSEDILTQLKEIIAAADFAVFLLTPDDIARIRNHREQVVRDNVIFELGMSLSVLGKQRCFVIIPRDTKLHLPTDLAGLIPATYRVGIEPKTAALGPACNKIKLAIRRHQFRPERLLSADLIAHHEINWANELNGATKEVRAYGFGLVNIADVNRNILIQKIISEPSFAVSIILGKPDSAAAATRMQDEKDNHHATKDIAKILLRLTEIAKSQLTSRKQASRFKLLVSDKYPTNAVIIIDSKMYIFPYLFGLLGTDAPVLRIQNYAYDNRAKPFLQHLLELEKAASFPDIKTLNAIYGTGK